MLEKSEDKFKLVANQKTAQKSLTVSLAWSRDRAVRGRKMVVKGGEFPDSRHKQERALTAGSGGGWQRGSGVGAHFSCPLSRKGMERDDHRISHRREKPGHSE